MVELVDQALDAAGFFERVEVLALDVLDQRHRQRGLVGDLAHQAPAPRPARRSAPRASAVRRR
jgi:hypothetical protein